MLAQHPVRVGDTPSQSKKIHQGKGRGSNVAFTVTYRERMPYFWPLRTVIPREHLILGFLSSSATSTEYQMGQVASNDTARTGPKPNPL